MVQESQVAIREKGGHEDRGVVRRVPAPFHRACWRCRLVVIRNLVGQTKAGARSLLRMRHVQQTELAYKVDAIPTAQLLSSYTSPGGWPSCGMLVDSDFRALQYQSLLYASLLYGVTRGLISHCVSGIMRYTTMLLYFPFQITSHALYCASSLPFPLSTRRHVVRCFERRSDHRGPLVRRSRSSCHRLRHQTLSLDTVNAQIPTPPSNHLAPRASTPSCPLPPSLLPLPRPLHLQRHLHQSPMPL